MKPPGQSNPSPRPESTSSCASVQSNTSALFHCGKKGEDDICVGEELKIAVATAIERFRLSEDQRELEFPSSLTSTERAYIHRYVAPLGLKSKSKGKSANRYVTVSKKDSSIISEEATAFSLMKNTRSQIMNMMQKFPLTSKEKQDLQPRTERGQHYEELVRTSTGRLNNGVPQVPPQKNSSDLVDFTQDLPIQSFRADISQAVNNYKVILISGETGSGKTTQVPQMILDDARDQNKACRIFCTQPRRLAAISVAERVAQERGEKIGQTVGYQIRLESRTSPKTLLTFCTNGVLLRTLMAGDAALSTVTHVIVDEIHERDRFSDFLLIVLKDVLPKYRNLRLILMSATLNIQLFTAYFNGCPVISVPGRQFVVEDYFLEDILKLTNYSNKEMLRYRKDISKVPGQQKKLHDWCSQMVEATKTHGSDLSEVENPENVQHVFDEVFDKDESDEGITVEDKEVEDLDDQLVSELDNLLSAIWLGGDQYLFNQIFHLLSSENVSVDYQHSETSVTPLMVAAGRGMFKCVEQLLNLGATVNIKASNEWTALDWAKNFEKHDVVDLLESYIAVSDVGVEEKSEPHTETISRPNSEDQLLLDIYNHTCDDEKVNLDLILCLLRYIHAGEKEGAILVFLPGYEDIINLRDKILEDKKFADCNRYIIYTLHSLMQSTDQRRVFKRPPSGVRKIVLSTNIAETSVTVDDIVFVIDGGKVKEKSFDALTSVSMLKANWISKASAEQRKGRAGRCQPGICYHIFSRMRFDSLQAYQSPELLRYPLQELCLHTKLLAPQNTSIADFLSKAPEAPAFLNVRNAVHLLKQIDALDPFEDLTEMGHHLADLPLEPKYGKMILCSVVLKCLDPVLTIASALSYKDPFQLPAQPNLKRKAGMMKRQLAAGTFSDHMAILRGFQGWQKSKLEGWERSYCEQHFVSASTMEMIMGMRTQLLGQLRASGFVRARGGGDIRDLNSNSENWAVVKAALCAGMYPSVIKVDRAKGKMHALKENKIRFHMSSVLSPEPKHVTANTHQKILKKLPTEWLIYEEMTRAHRLAQVKCCTLLSPITLILFGGPAKLSSEIVKNIEDIPKGYAEQVGQSADHSDSDGEEKQGSNSANATLSLDAIIHIKMDAETLNMVLTLRQKWHSMFIRRMRSPSKPWSPADEHVIRTTVNVLTNEEQSLGLQQPAGIGQRPRPMSNENLVSSGGMRTLDDQQVEIDTEVVTEVQEKLQMKARPFKLQQTSPGKKREFLKFARGTYDEKYDQYFSRYSGSPNNSGTSSAQESQESTPCASPGPADNVLGGNACSKCSARLPHCMYLFHQALESLNKKDIGEIKSYGRPPVQVEMVMEAVMILRGGEPTWAEAKRHLGDQNFIKQLMNFDKDNISDRVLKKISQYVSKTDFDPSIVGRVSFAAQSLCMWVRAMEMYGRVYRVVEPKRQRLNAAQSQLREKQAMLQEAKDKLAEVEAKMAELQQQYTEKLKQKEELKEKAEHTEKMLMRASQLVSGLAGERERWEHTVAELEEKMGYLIGDVLIASAFLSYAGPFLSNYREDLVQKTWMVEIQKLEVPFSPNFSFCDFMVDPTKVREWNIQGLPSDSFSTENGVIVSRGRRWPLMVDPQGQAIKWIKSMEMSKGLKVVDLQQHDYMRQMETAIQFGLPVLLQNVHEKLDPSLDPILNKSIIKIGGAPIIRLGDKEIEYNYDFRFYITTKLSNPHYAPEIATKSTIVNFAVKQQGLEAQLLGIVVRKERPDLEEQKDNLVLNIAAGKKRLKELEDEILRLLNEAQGSLLDDEKLVNTLQTSKATSQEVSEQLSTSEQTEAKIDAAREGYRSCAQRASILFFVLNDMGLIDPMYVFALDAYIELFNLSIDKSQRSSKLEERIVNLNDYHTYAVYKYTCLGLFERHKLLFSFHMCSKILEATGKLNMDEYDFFLRGGVVVDRENQMDNPVPWLPDTAWDNVTELDKLTNFHGIITSFEQYPRDWNIWFTSAEPETAPLPGEWDNACNELQRMLLVRSLRPDRVSFCITSFIINNLGSKFVEPPVTHLPTVVEDSTTRTPLIFVLSPGVDPTSKLLQLAESSDMASRFHALSLGQGQAPIATRMIKEGVREGNWVYLANCHLSLSWMPQLDKLVEQLQIEEPHPEFRLWLSSSPHPDFPISILQTGIKMTTEPPKGLKANINRLYQLITDQQFTRCQKPDKYKKLLFCLCYFHSVLLERRKFLMLGWNIPYEFNDSDFEVSENLLSLYLDEYEDTPWEALKYLIAGINYGGHVTDDMDRRLLLTYINDYFTEDSVAQPFFKLSSLATYYVPKDGPLSSYKEYISMLPNMDHPEAFGQHPNADITSQIQETRMTFDTLLGLQPAITTGVGESREDKVLGLAESIKNQMPENIDYVTTAKILSVDPSPLNVVLLQEIERYNLLLDLIRSQLTDLERGIQGLVVMSSDLEEIFQCIFDGRVPSSWQKTYPSMKPLASWTRDLVLRVDQFEKWATTAHPPMVFWLSSFTFPTGFLTAVLQTAARKNNVSVDLLSWEFTVLTVSDSNLTGPPKDGVYCKGMYLQGAGWDQKNACLVEAEPMQLVCPIPTIHFKPVESKRRSQKGIYTCPCYYYPNRAGKTGRASFVVAVDLKSGDKPADHWVKRGTALLMSLDS